MLAIFQSGRSFNGKGISFGHIALAIEFYDNLLNKCKLYVAHGYHPNGQLIEYSDRSAKNETSRLPGKLNIDEVSELLNNYIKIPLPLLNITPEKIKVIEQVLKNDFKAIKHMGGKIPVALEKHSQNRIYKKKEAWTLHQNNCAHLAYDLLPQLGYEVGWWRAVFLRPYTMAKVAGETADELLDRHVWDLCNASKSLPPLRLTKESPGLANPERGALADMLIDHHLQRLHLEEQLAKASHTGVLSTVRKLKMEFLGEIRKEFRASGDLKDAVKSLMKDKPSLYNRACEGRSKTCIALALTVMTGAKLVGPQVDSVFLKQLTQQDELKAIYSAIENEINRLVAEAKSNDPVEPSYNRVQYKEKISYKKAKNIEDALFKASDKIYQITHADDSLIDNTDRLSNAQIHDRQKTREFAAIVLLYTLPALKQERGFFTSTAYKNVRSIASKCQINNDFLQDIHNRYQLARENVTCSRME